MARRSLTRPPPTPSCDSARYAAALRRCRRPSPGTERSAGALSGSAGGGLSAKPDAPSGGSLPEYQRRCTDLAVGPVSNALTSGGDTATHYCCMVRHGETRRSELALIGLRCSDHHPDASDSLLCFSLCSHRQAVVVQGPAGRPLAHGPSCLALRVSGFMQRSRMRRGDALRDGLDLHGRPPVTRLLVG